MKFNSNSKITYADNEAFERILKKSSLLKILVGINDFEETEK